MKRVGKSVHRQAGAALISLIGMIVVFSAIGAGMVSLYGVSTTGTATPDNAMRARYMAESGIRYAVSQIRNASDTNTTVAALAAPPLFNLGNDQGFAITVFMLGNFISRTTGSPINSNDPLTVESPYGDFTTEFVNQMSTAIASADNLWLVNEADSVSFTQGQNLIRLAGVAGYSGNQMIITCQDAFTAADGDTLHLAVDVTSGGSLTAGSGGTIEVGTAGSILPETNGVVYIKGTEYVYDTRTDAGGGRYDLNFSSASASVSVNPADFVVLNSDGSANLSISATGHAGSGGRAASASLSYNAPASTGSGSGGSSSGTYASGAGAPTYTDESGDAQSLAFGNPDTGYTGAAAGDGTALDESNLADLDTGLSMESGGQNAGSDALNCQAVYGGNDVSGGDFYADSGNYESAITTGSASVVTSADFAFTSGDWYDFSLSVNDAGSNETVWRFGSAGTGYVELSTTLAPQAGWTRSISNFIIQALGTYQNANRYFKVSVRNLAAEFDGTAWPTSGSLPDFSAGTSDWTSYYVASQRETGASSMTITGEFSFEWDSETDTAYGMVVTTYMHDILE